MKQTDKHPRRTSLPRRRSTDRSGRRVEIEVEHDGSERLRRVEVVAGNLDALVRKMAQKARAHAGGGEMTLHSAVRRGASAYVFEDLLHLNDVAFQAGEFGDAR